jgi:hypothetical protein
MNEKYNSSSSGMKKAAVVWDEEAGLSKAQAEVCFRKTEKEDSLKR